MRFLTSRECLLQYADRFCLIRCSTNKDKLMFTVDLKGTILPPPPSVAFRSSLVFTLGLAQQASYSNKYHYLLHHDVCTVNQPILVVFTTAQQVVHLGLPTWWPMAAPSHFVRGHLGVVHDGTQRPLVSQIADGQNKSRPGRRGTQVTQMTQFLKNKLAVSTKRLKVWR